MFWAAVATGIFFRLAIYLDNRTLWLDESFLAINLVDKPFSDLLGRLEFLQTAPVGFLIAERSAVSLLGDSEYALRLVPLLASVAALALFAHVARRLLVPPAALLALVLFATNPVLLYQSSELKPYSSDVAVALLLVALALHGVPPDGVRSWRRLLPLAVVAPVAVWFSFPAIVVLGAIAAFLAVSALRAGERRFVAGVGLLSASWLVSFGAVYAVASSSVAGTTEAVFGDGEHGRGRVAGVVHNMWSTFVDPAGFQNGTNGLAVMLAAVAVISLARRREWSVLVLLALPLSFAALAALLDKYPLGGRFSLFLVPFVVLLVVAGVQAVVSLSRSAVVASLLGVFLAMAPVAMAAWGLFDPPRREEMKPLLRRLTLEWKPGDALYVYRNAQYALRYYGTCRNCKPWPGTFPWRLRPAASSSGGEEFAPALLSDPPTLIVGEQYREPTVAVGDVELLPRGRVWLLFSHVSSPLDLNEESLFRAALDRRGRLVDRAAEEGASLYLYQLSGPTPP